MKRYACTVIFSLVGFFCYGLPAMAQAGNKAQVKEKLNILAFQTVKTRCQECKVSIAFKRISPKIDDISANRIIGLYFDKPGLPSGYVNASVDLKDTSPTLKGAVQMYITLRKKVPVASTRIEHGGAVEASHIDWRWKDITRLNRQPVSSSVFFKNKVATHIISAGDIIFKTDMAGTHSLKSGDRVTMLYKKAGVRIKINCVVRTARGGDDKIKLYSSETGHRYVAKVVNDNKTIWVRTL